MTSYIELEQQAKELMEKANAIRQQERAAVLADTRRVIDEWKFSVRELGMTRGRRTSLPMKYRDPNTGKEWCGRGAMPKWLSAHLAVGHTKEQFLIA